MTEIRYFRTRSEADVFLKELGKYRNPDAVDAMIWESSQMQPQTYFASCGNAECYEKEKNLRAALDTKLMTLPCSNGSDARSLEAGTLAAGEILTAKGSIFNASGNLWYETEAGSYVYAGHVEELGFFESLWQKLFG